MHSLFSIHSIIHCTNRITHRPTHTHIRLMHQPKKRCCEFEVCMPEGLSHRIARHTLFFLRLPNTIRRIRASQKIAATCSVYRILACYLCECVCVFGCVYMCVCECKATASRLDRVRHKTTRNEMTMGLVFARFDAPINCG